LQFLVIKSQRQLFEDSDILCINYLTQNINKSMLNKHCLYNLNFRFWNIHVHVSLQCKLYMHFLLKCKFFYNFWLQHNNNIIQYIILNMFMKYLWNIYEIFIYLFMHILMHIEIKIIWMHISIAYHGKFTKNLVILTKNLVSFTKVYVLYIYFCLHFTKFLSNFKHSSKLGWMSVFLSQNSAAGYIFLFIFPIF